MQGRQLAEARRELAARARDRGGERVGRQLGRPRTRALGGELLQLTVDPGTLPAGERRGLALRSPARQGHPHDAVVGDAQDVAPRAGVADELKPVAFRVPVPIPVRVGVPVPGSGFGRVEDEGKLHQWPP